MLGDVLPTGFEVGVLHGRVGPGDTVVIVGAGAIGLAALQTARLYSPSEIIVVDLDENRLLTASDLGATHVVNSSNGLAAAAVLDLTGGVGADVAIEAVGLPATFDLCQSIVAPGGRIANVGVHRKALKWSCRTPDRRRPSAPHAKVATSRRVSTRLEREAT